MKYQPEYQNDGNRDPDQPEKNAFTHIVVLFGLVLQ